MAEIGLSDLRPVVVLTGISASGKTTIGEMLAGRFDRGVHLRGDVFRTMITTGRAEMSVPLSEEARAQLKLRYRLSALCADVHHEAGFSVVVQDVIFGTGLAEYLSLLRSRPLVPVVLAPAAEVVVAREAARPKKAYGEPEAEIQAFDAVLRTETPRIGLWVDNCDQTPAQTVDYILQNARLLA